MENKESKLDEQWTIPLNDLIKANKDEIERVKAVIDKDADLKRAFQKEDIELIILRSILGSKGRKDVVGMLRASSEYRIQCKTWELEDFNQKDAFSKIPFADHVTKYLPRSSLEILAKNKFYISWDYIGDIALQPLADGITSAEYKEYCIKRMALMYRYMNKCSREEGKLLGTYYIGDLQNITRGHLKFITYFQHDINMAQVLCPEMLCKCYGLNAPWFFNLIWSIITPLLDEVTRAKISLTFTEEENKNAFNSIVTEDVLPKRYGGKGVYESLKIANPDGNYKVATIVKGDIFVHKVDVEKAGTKVSWKFKTRQRNIVFEAEFSPRKSKTFTVVEKGVVESQTKEIEGEFVAKERGSLVLTWDNTAAYWYSKELLFICESFAPEDQA